MRKSRVKASALLLIHPVVQRHSIKKATEQQVSFYLLFLQCIFHMCCTGHCRCCVWSPTALDPCCTSLQPGDVRGWGMTAWLIYPCFAWWSLCSQHILLVEWDPKPSFSCPLCSLLFFLSLLNLCNVWNLLLWSSAYWKQRSFPGVIKAQEPFWVSQITLVSQEVSPGVCQLSYCRMFLQWHGQGMPRAASLLLLSSAFYTLGEADAFHAIPSVNYYTPNVSCWLG